MQMNHTTLNKPTKAYIIRLSKNQKSVEYAKQTANSCDVLGINWEYFEGYDHLSVADLIKTSGLKVWSYTFDMSDGGASASFSHFKLWEKIRDNKETAIILEHDALMLHNLDLEIPDNTIVNLGYKVSKYQSYDYKKAGSPKEIISIPRHAGAHAYAITYNTADFLLKELEKIGFYYTIDAAYFLPPRSLAASSINMAITNPVCAVGWLRDSTIDFKSSNFNFEMIDSFIKNFKPVELKDKPNIAFLDYSEIDYNYETLNTKGLGGSETAVVNMAKLLSSEYNVFVFNNTSKKGLIDGVYYFNYKDTSDIDYQYQSFDIFISVRSVLPFVSMNYVMEIWNKYQFNYEYVFALIKNSKYKILWAHDTITPGEEYLKIALENKLLDKIFVLSDYQYNIYLNKDEDFASYFKTDFFRTRNGISKINKADLSLKDPNLFVFTSAYVKGMRALLEDIWPQLKKEIPDAKLKIVGGSYKELQDEDFDQATYWDKEFIKARKKYNNTLDIEFVGFKIKKQLDEYYQKASYLLFPSEYPETFGLTILEAMNNNVCIITNSYGALEEICPHGYCYLINGKFKKENIPLFIDAAKQIYNDKNLREEVMLRAEKYKETFLWDNIFNEWDIIFKNILGIKIDENKILKYQKYVNLVLSLYNQRVINN
jgi:glycosyltransferase involved in cell wall biosynthesis